MSKRSQLPSLTSLKEILRESAFDPRNPDGPNAIIVETGLHNPRYIEDRGKELIARAQFAFDQKAGNPDQAAQNLAEYQRLMGQAIGLLAFARALRA